MSSRAGFSSLRVTIFGLSVSSSWGNGHAALWRGLIRALLAEGHSVHFFERDEPYYAAHRDLWSLPERGDLTLYSDWPSVSARARAAIAQSDVAILTSYCPDARSAAPLMLESACPLRCFYDLDTPVTLAKLAAAEPVDYIPPEGLGGFDLVLSYTGGAALDALRDRLGARDVRPLYGSVDPDVHRRVQPQPHYAASLSYLGTYAKDRQGALERLLIEPARHCTAERFVIGGAQYPPDFPWLDNIYFVQHLPPSEHPAFYSSSRLTLNVTRAAMAQMGWCPSGRLFEAAACGTAIISDDWEGLASFFEPGQELLIATSAEEIIAALKRPDSDLQAIGKRAQARVMEAHTAAHRAQDLVAAFESSGKPHLMPSEV